MYNTTDNLFVRLTSAPFWTQKWKISDSVKKSRHWLVDEGMVDPDWWIRASSTLIGGYNKGRLWLVSRDWLWKGRLFFSHDAIKFSRSIRGKFGRVWLDWLETFECSRSLRRRCSSWMGCYCWNVSLSLAWFCS